MSNFKLEEGMLFIEVIKPEEKKEAMQKTEAGIFIPNTSPQASHEWQDCKIVATCDEEKYPVGSTWMIGSDPGVGISYHGQVYTLFSTGKLRARVD
jgi:hemin uptake protein HemP|tara:strand:+ start:9145 stop:9432 length:288 start_codon:yes stop_codon:yes gene_type:complete